MIKRIPTVTDFLAYVKQPRHKTLYLPLNRFTVISRQFHYFESIVQLLIECVNVVENEKDARTNVMEVCTVKVQLRHEHMSRNHMPTFVGIVWKYAVTSTVILYRVFYKCTVGEWEFLIIHTKTNHSMPSIPC